MDKEDVGEQGTTNSAAETGNEVDEADGLFLKVCKIKDESIKRQEKRLILIIKSRCHK